MGLQGSLAPNVSHWIREVDTIVQAQPAITGAAAWSHLAINNSVVGAGAVLSTRKGLQMSLIAGGL
jgi:hypothetical protein